MRNAIAISEPNACSAEGLIDSFGRRITYLRVSITRNCNLRCRYCMPDGQLPRTGKNYLPAEQVVHIVRTAVGMGIRKVRLTGGEPLVHPQIIEIVRQLGVMSEIDDLCLTTNGVLLGRLAKALKQAGLHRVNVSLDTLEPDAYRWITRGGEVNRVLEGIRMARKVGLTPVKINCVVEHDATEPAARGVAAFAAQEGLEVRFIRRMSLKAGRYWRVIGGSGGECTHCNRLRISSDGQVVPCLFDDRAFSIETLGVDEAIARAVRYKPLRGTSRNEQSFALLGG